MKYAPSNQTSNGRTNAYIRNYHLNAFGFYSITWSEDIYITYMWDNRTMYRELTPWQIYIESWWWWWWWNAFYTWSITPYNVTLDNCNTQTLQVENGACTIDLTSLTWSCITQDDWIYQHCSAENDYIQVDFYNVLEPQNWPNLSTNIPITNAFTFKDSNWIFTRGSSFVRAAIKTKSSAYNFNYVYWWNSQEADTARPVYLYNYNESVSVLNQLKNELSGDSKNVIYTNTLNPLATRINSASFVFDPPNVFTQWMYTISLGLYLPCVYSIDNAEVCEWSDWFVYINWEKTGERNENKDNVQDWLNVTYPSQAINEWWATPWISWGSNIGVCGNAYSRRDVWDWSWIDILTIIPCWVPYIANKAFEFFKKIFSFNFSLSREKETEGFWDWVINHADADWLGYEWEGNSQINEIVENLWNNSVTQISNNFLWLSKIVFKIFINIAAFVFMLSCFVNTTKNYSGESTVWAGFKIFTFIFFLFTVISLEFLTQFTDLNPLWLNALFNFIDFGYRTAIEMMLLGVIAHTARNFI